MHHRVHIRKLIPKNVIGVAYSTFTKCRLEALAAVSSKWYLLKARNWFVNVADVEISVKLGRYEQASENICISCREVKRIDHCLSERGKRDRSSVEKRGLKGHPEGPTSPY